MTENWSETVECIPETICKIYLAEITGSDPTYQFARSFVRLSYDYSDNKIHCEGEIPDNGVFEFCARWYAVNQAEYVKRNRYWFALIDGTYVPVQQAAVLPFLRFLHKQQGAMGDYVSDVEPA